MLFGHSEPPERWPKKEAPVLCFVTARGVPTTALSWREVESDEIPG